MPDGKKLLGAFFGNLITGIGKKRYQDFVANQEASLGEKENRQGQQNELVSTALTKALDPDTPFMERVRWMKLYKGQTGVELPTPSPIGAPELDPANAPGGGVAQDKPVDLYDFLEGASVTEQQDFLQKSAERQKTLAGADAQTALAEQRRKPDDAGGGSGGGSGTAGGKLELDKLKTQFGQLNTQYDDLAKLIPKDIYGQPTIDANDPRVQELQRIDAERNRVYNKMYGGEKKTIPGF